MGVEQRVTFAGSPPPWQEVRDVLARSGFPVQMRLIDGQLAFPDEEPPESWQELRVAAAGGMVTLRRSGQELACVTWGNADAPLRQAWNALAWACAAAGAGQVQTEAGPQDAEAFRRTADLPEVLRMAKEG
jgi:hypothetical protein